jgi:phosphopantetheine--protein transferase-like protein
MIEEKAAAYLSRISGKLVTRDRTIVLSSAQNGAFCAWLRKEGLQPESLGLSGAPFTIEGLFNPQTKKTIPENRKGPAVPVRAVGGSGDSVLGIGIDIEDPRALPEANDYRTHEFYSDNFSPAEISYCILQPSTHVSLTGLWAAKEAIVKSGAVRVSSSQGLRNIEILHDDAGRPLFPSCLISIAHTNQVSVAVAIWRGPVSLSGPKTDETSLAGTGATEASPWRYLRQKAVGIALVFVALSAAAYWLFNHAWL